MDPQLVVLESPTMRDFRFNDHHPIESTEIRLTNKDLWDQFYNLQTEMIITKTGRRMFPSLSLKISNLDPSADYCLFLELNVVSHCRFKYAQSVGWSPGGHEEAQSPQRLYLHPESPSKGSHWMSQYVSFSRVKLTNTCSPPQGQMVLSSMHKYQPKILIVKSSNIHALRWAPTKSVIFPETQFIAVTAYQNEKITKLKINYNPFAKGFRENGKSNIKRKQICDDQEMGAVKKIATPSPPPKEVEEDRAKRMSSSSVAMPFCSYVYPSYPLYGQWWTSPLPWLYQTSYVPQENQSAVPAEARKPKKITDFSISAIIGAE